MDKWMLRPSQYGALEAFIMGNSEPGSIISPDLYARARTAVGQTVQVPVFDAESVSLGSSRSVTIADSENTTQLYTITFTLITWGFTIVPAMFMNQEVSIQQDFDRKFRKYLFKVAETLDTAGIAALSTAKSQVFADLLGLYTNTGNTVVAPLAQKDEIIGDLTAIMNANDYYGSPYKVVGNPGLMSLVNKQSQYSQFNEQDKTIQWLDKRFGYTNRLANDAAKIATGYIINPNSVGHLLRNERESILGTVLPDGHEWGIENLPMLGLPVDTYFYQSAGDFNAIAGAATADLTRGAKDHYGFALEFAFVTAYNTDPATHASPIVRFSVANA